jgi:hypothetical protein
VNTSLYIGNQENMELFDFINNSSENDSYEDSNAVKNHLKMKSIGNAVGTEDKSHIVLKTYTDENDISKVSMKKSPGVKLISHKLHRLKE